MHTTIKKNKHLWIVTSVAIILALIMLIHLPTRKGYSLIIFGLAGGHLLIGLLAVFAGWILLLHNPLKINHMTQEKLSLSVKADYGQDMPGIIITAAIIGFVFTALAIFLYQLTQNLIYTLVFGILAAFLYSLSIAGIWSSRYGKLKLRDKVISNISFTGSEKILDIGCGKGLLLIEAAKRVPNGKATGADTWDKTLEYSYTAQMALNNAKIEGVENRVIIETADVQCMPFENNSFDIVMTSLMMHHVPDTETAVKEMARVIRPGGSIVIADVNAKRFVHILESAGMKKITRIYATRLFFMPAYVVSAVKPIE